MMFSSCIARFVHIGRPCWATDKSLLATLRKKTGYTFTNCKKALELHNNDIEKAEKWLNQQAQTMGWSKATKLEGRQTKQGLVAVVVSQNSGAMVEVNCETDFVAKNEKFHSMVDVAARACLHYTEKQPLQHDPLTKIGLDHEQLKSLQANDGKSLADHMALTIGSLGENAVLRRAVCFKTATGVYLSGYTHPSTGETSKIMTGKFGALLAYKSAQPKTELMDTFARKLCQHIVGMNPTKIGSMNDKPAKNRDEEPCLIYQDYVLDEAIQVKDVLKENNVEVVDFKRFECGDHDDDFADQQQPLQYAESRQ